MSPVAQGSAGVVEGELDLERSSPEGTRGGKSLAFASPPGAAEHLWGTSQGRGRAGGGEPPGAATGSHRLRSQTRNVLSGQLSTLTREEAGARRALVSVYLALNECQTQSSDLSVCSVISSFPRPWG